MPPSGTDALPGGRYRLGLRTGLIALCVGSLLVGAVALAEDIGSGQPNVAPAGQANHEIEALLRQVEQQITSGNTTSLSDNNALVTWYRVITLAFLAAPGTRETLMEFVEHMRSRAADERAAGRLEVAIYLTVFADEATELTQRMSAASASSLAAVPPVAPAGTIPDASPSTLPTGLATRDTQPSETPNGSAQSAAPAESLRSEIGPTQAQMPPAGSAATSASVASSAALNKEAIIPASAAGDTGVASAILAPHPNVTTRTAQEQAAAAAFASRGDAMLAIRDISAARKLYEYAANAGSARAATALAETYDPGIINQLGTVGLRPDPVMAADWYRKAAALGDRAAEVRLQTLRAEAAR